MSSVRLSGKSEKLGQVSTSQEFLTWEVPDVDSEKRMRRVLKRIGKGALVLDAAKYGGMDFGHTAHATFIEQDDFSLGRNESAHQVRFGQMILNGADFREQPELVAVKSYEDRADLYREWAAHEYINSLFDRQVGYVNLGVHNDIKNQESIISQYDHDVTSFDSSFWADEDAPASALRPSILQRHALLGLQGLGMMHGARMTHGDAQVKNLAADRLGPRAIDLETAMILSEETIDDESSILQTRRDISAFIESMGRVDQNRQQIIDALSGQATVQKLVKAYSLGVKKGRAALEGEYVPDFGRQNEDVIHTEFEKLSR